MNNFLKIILLSLLPLTCLGTTFSCGSPNTFRLPIPEDIIQWDIGKDKEGYIGINAYVPEKIDNKVFESALVVGSFAIKADIAVPLKTEKVKGSINFSLMLHESADEKVEVLLTYSSYDGPCISSSNIYSAQVPHNNARQ